MATRRGLLRPGFETGGTQGKSLPYPMIHRSICKGRTRNIVPWVYLLLKTSQLRASQQARQGSLRPHPQTRRMTLRMSLHHFRIGGIEVSVSLSGLPVLMTISISVLGCDSGTNCQALRKQGAHCSASSGAEMSDSSSCLLRRKIRSSKRDGSDDESTSLKPR